MIHLKLKEGIWRVYLEGFNSDLSLNLHIILFSWWLLPKTGWNTYSFTHPGRLDPARTLPGASHQEVDQAQSTHVPLIWDCWQECQKMQIKIQQPPQPWDKEGIVEHLGGPTTDGNAEQDGQPVGRNSQTTARTVTLWKFSTDNSTKNRFFAKFRKALRNINTLTQEMPGTSFKQIKMAFVYKLVQLLDNRFKPDF